MKRNARCSRITLVVLLTALLWPQGLVSAQAPAANPCPCASTCCVNTCPCPTPTPTPTPKPAATPTPTPPCGNSVQDDDLAEAGQKIKLYYMRQGSQIAQVLTAAAKPEKSLLHGLIVASPAEDEIILYGQRKARSQARRIIATLDLPRPGIMMEMWGLQISSNNREELADVMTLVHKEIDRTQVRIRRFYNAFERAARTVEVDEQFRNMLEERLFYTRALRPNHPLSLSDILLLLLAAKEPIEAHAKVANALQAWSIEQRKREAAEHPPVKVKKNKKEEKTKEAPVLQRFFSVRGLHWEGTEWKNDGSIEEVSRRTRQGRLAVIDFAYQYGQLVHQPQCFSSYYLQQAAEILNTRLQASIDLLNLDIQEMFVAPTMDRIRDIVSEFDDVEYAQVGKTTVASLSGVTAEVASTSVNAFDVTPPLRLSELLKTADSLSKSVTPFDPAANVVGALPLGQVIGLIGALGEERSVWRELQSGVTIKVTPNVLRDMNSAELAVDFKTGDPQVANPPAGVRPISRVSKHEVKTSIYVEPMDFFDLSAFISQSTLNGGRRYVPIIGPVWRGVFGEIPVAGDLFSWKRGPKTVFSQSVVLTTSFITPTAMGVAILYPTELTDPANGEEFRYKDVFKCQRQSVANFKNGIANEMRRCEPATVKGN